MFINHEYVENLLNSAKSATKEEIDRILDEAEKHKGLSHEDIAVLLQTTDESQMNRIFKIAGDIKRSIYGNRIVVFAPLYVSDYCVNNCKYCGYKRDNEFHRTRLTMEQIQNEVRILEKLGHKRLAFEAGEDPVNCTMDYILDAIDAIYNTKLDNGAIRRINVNIAATTVENYKLLKDKGIGTYILFQETYHKPIYEDMHPKSIKGDYNYHLTAFDRAMQGGIDDVGGGVLFGLADYKFEVLSLMLHNEHLEKEYGVGFHTISVPRLKQADGMSIEDFPHLVSDDEFKKLVAIIRLAVPFTGLILSTRETVEMRQEVIKYGVSQVSAGSCASVGGYKDKEFGNVSDQFQLSDERSPMEVLKSLMNHGYIPSYCTACYRNGRTGDRFMSLAKSGQIQHVCQPNAMMTLTEYALDYGDDEFKLMAQKVIDQELEKIERPDIKELLINNLKRLHNGERDLFL